MAKICEILAIYITAQLTVKTMTTIPLREKRNQLIKKLHNLSSTMLRGSFVKKYRRCGKAKCHCASEGQGHESHYLSVSMSGRSPIMIYVSLTNQNMVKEALANYQNAQQILEEISNINRELLSQKEIL